ncbi:retrovirus-related Pol polyprotein from transposon opus [Trichonephila clavata]|uniref:Retrovirus-related Pol polyprotein from transposon opus n=1 Tax=Trichonephila clavata TaxID=2740835 RepID=A0A8X6K822_TRICU|nr:retrovirus-related Pol polyprotein from transposon opus [Trichonephila clavata]
MQTCQLRRTMTYKDRIPIQPIVRPNNPFEVWSVDCIGPLEPRSRRRHEYIVCAIDLCSREKPHALTGVSPYQLVYGRLPSGPMTILKEFWTGEREIPTGAARSVEEYLKQLQKKLQDAHEIASENSAKNQERMTSHYNLRTREKSFSVGDEVLILMPSSTYKLLNTWIGPAKVVKLTRPHSCLVRMEDGNTRELHVNKLRPYISRVDHVE